MLYPTPVCLLFGDRVEHSISPLIHNTAFKCLGLPFSYVAYPIQAEDVGKAITKIDGKSILGANVTIPHKMAVIPYLDSLSAEAKAVGAVNTIHVQDGKKVGHNTDIEGFLAPLDQTTFLDKNIVVLGAGGAARAVMVAVHTKLRPKSLTLVSRRVEKARAACDTLGFGEAADYSDIQQLVSSADLIVNATPLGMPPLQDEMPFPLNIQFQSHQTVYDLVYKPKKTRLLLLAEQQGASTIGGLPMLIAQAAAAFKIWTGKTMPVGEVEAALNNVIL